MDLLLIFCLFIAFPIAMLLIILPRLMKLGLYVWKFFDPNIVNDPQFKAATEEDILI